MGQAVSSSAAAAPAAAPAATTPAATPVPASQKPSSLVPTTNIHGQDEEEKEVKEDDIDDENPTIVMLCASHLSRPERVPMFLRMIESWHQQNTKFHTYVMLSTKADVVSYDDVVSQITPHAYLHIVCDQDTPDSHKRQFNKYKRLTEKLALSPRTWVCFCDDDDILAPDRNDILLATARLCLGSCFCLRNVIRFSGATTLEEAMRLCQSNPPVRNMDESVKPWRVISWRTNKSNCVYWQFCVRAKKWQSCLESVDVDLIQADLRALSYFQNRKNMKCAHVDVENVYRGTSWASSFVYGYCVHVLGDWKQPTVV
jgi:hypothetical protein